MIIYAVLMLFSPTATQPMFPFTGVAIIFLGTRIRVPETFIMVMLMYNYLQITGDL